MTTAQSITPFQQPAPVSVGPIADPATEAALLGHLLMGISPTDFKPYAHLTEAHFHIPKHQHLWRVMLALVKDGCSIDMVQVKGRLKLTPDGEAYLMTLVAQAGDNPADYVKWLRRIEWRRDVKAQLLKAIAATDNHNMTDESLALMVNQSATALQVKVSRILGPMSHTEREMGEQYRLSYDTEDVDGVGIATGFPDLDNAMNGFKKGSTYVIGAASGVGKSIMGQMLARYQRSIGNIGAVLSFELPVGDYLARAVAMETGIDLNRIQKHQCSADETLRLHESLKRIAGQKTDLHYVYLDRPTLSEFKSKIVELCAAHLMRFMVIDYLDARWFTPTERAHMSNDVAFTGAISAMLNTLAKELGIFFIILVQINRASQNNGGAPKLTDFSGASAIEKDAGFAAILIDSVEYSAGLGYGETEMHILKSRTGGKGDVIKLRSRKNIFTFEALRGDS